MHVAAHEAGGVVSSASVPQALIDKERKIATEKAAESGKPAEIITKMRRRFGAEVS